ncbi:MAG TPA: tetratricopeptide repeat protein [Polyangia bacterium]|nr:tetratricopeptide repeat protein [Polyangia bacterium]
MRRIAIAAALAASSAFSSLAFADEIDNLGAKVIELDGKIGDLDSKLKPPLPPGPEIADRRLIDAQVLYELKNYEAASIILFDVVEKYPNSPAYPEALYYLADSLFLKRDYLSSRRFFEKIVDQGPSNPRYQESLERLIDLALHTSDYSPVDGYITKLNALPAGKQLPSVPYVEGKYFFFHHEFDKALATLKQIGPDHVYYFHSLYFVGASQVAMGGEHLADAIMTFGTILKTPAKTDSQKRITELAHLALARIYYDRGQFTNALAEYQRIGLKSEYLNEALYESAWVSIKGKEYDKAARSLDLLMLNSPDSPLIPEVKLLIGQLHIRENAYQPATDTFIKTRDEYAPVHRQLYDALMKTGNAPVYFRDIIAKNLSRFDLAEILPPVANRWMSGDESVQHVTTLIGDEGDLKKSLDESEEIIRRLDKAMTGPARVNVFPELATARAKSIAVANEVSVVKEALAGKMSKLIGAIGGSEQELKGLEAERDALEQKMRTLPVDAESMEERQRRARSQFNELDKRVVEMQTELNGMRASMVATRKFYQDEVQKTLPAPQQANAQAELDTALAEVEGQSDASDRLRKDLDDAKMSIGVDDADMQLAQELRKKYDDVLRRLHDIDVRVRSQLTPSDRAKAEQIESILDRAHGVENKVAKFNGRIDDMLDVRLKELLTEVNDEKLKIAAYRQQLGGYTTESADVGGGIMAEQFKAVTTRFYNVVVRAEVGIIDVAWALKDSSTRNTNRLVAERKRELKLLDDEYKSVDKSAEQQP